MHAPSPRSAKKLFLYNFLVNFSGSTVCKGLLFVCASACYDKAVRANEWLNKNCMGREKTNKIRDTDIAITRPKQPKCRFSENEK